MKNLIFAFCTLTILSNACKKDTPTNTLTDTLAGSYTGTLHLKSYTGLSSPQIYTRDTSFKVTMIVVVDSNVVSMDDSKYKITISGDTTFIKDWYSNKYIQGFSGHFWISDGYFTKTDSLYIKSDYGVLISHTLTSFAGKKN
jgi:hypothetical protein